MTQEIMDVLNKISGDIGELKGSTKALVLNLEKHIKDDDAVEVRVRAVEITQAKQRGSARVWGVVSNAGSAILGAAAAYWGSRHV
jgi:hypothetical protein